MSPAAATDSPAPLPVRQAAPARTNLLGLPRARMQAYFEALGEKPYRALQVMKWMYNGQVSDFDAMTDIARPLRRRLAEVAEIRAPALTGGERAADGVRRWLTHVAAGQAVETVAIPSGGRTTLCISSQIGCSLDCSFCATGKQGFNGNLSAAEIVGQAWQAERLLAPRAPDGSGLAPRGAPKQITNVVFMGMGEPLLNFDAVVDAAEVFLDDLAFGISKRRVTVSTAGVVPRIYDLAARADVALAVSLHAARDELRDELVPINRRYPIAELLDACRHYLRAGSERRSVTFEYTLLAGVNDADSDAQDLAALLADLRCKVNLIPFNPFPTPAGAIVYRRSSPGRTASFQKRLNDAGVQTMLRTTRGDDIAAACGQLTGRFQDRTRRRQRYLQGAA